jgi:hypothetical protein
MPAVLDKGHQRTANREIPCKSAWVWTPIGKTRLLCGSKAGILLNGHARPDGVAPLNGIEDIITRPDLADRAILLTLPYIPETERRPESAIWREFEAARPQILGALLEAASLGLRVLPTVRLKRLSRMADFALWAAACETALWPPGTFLRAYSENRRTAIEEVIEADSVATKVREMMAKRPTWTGSASIHGVHVRGCDSAFPRGS